MLETWHYMTSRAGKIRCHLTDQWQPNSPDLNPVDYTTWSIISSESISCRCIDKQRQCLLLVWCGMDQKIINSATDEWWHGIILITDKNRQILFTDNRWENLKHRQNTDKYYLPTTRRTNTDLSQPTNTDKYYLLTTDKKFCSTPTKYRQVLITHLVTHLVWPHQPENPPGRSRAQQISAWRSPSLFPLFYSSSP